MRAEQMRLKLLLASDDANSVLSHWYRLPPRLPLWARRSAIVLFPLSVPIWLACMIPIIALLLLIDILMLASDGVEWLGRLWNEAPR